MVWRVLRAAGVAIAAVILFGLGFFGLTWLRASGSAADWTGADRIAGLDAETRILRDNYGALHIFAETRADAYAAQGYAHAQDRLWQMDLARRLTAGRLAEIFGELALANDVRMRAWGYHLAAQRAEAALSPQERELLQAYADGVNAYLQSRDFRLPPEYHLTFTQPEPWSVLDTLYVLFSFWPTLSPSAQDEWFRERLRRDLGETLAGELFRPFPEGGRVALSEADLVAEMGPEILHAGAGAPPPAVLPPAQDGRGHSNNWAVGPARSRSGAPMLAGDPHLGLNMPGVWHLARLTYGEETVIGGAIPGAPGIGVGRNREIAWALTTTGADVQDTYFITVNPENPNEYLTPGGWAPFETRTERFKVRFGGEVVRELRSTRHGPVIPSEFIAFAGPDDIIAVASTFDRQIDRSARYYLGMNGARSLDEAADAARHFGLPPHNLVVAARDGEIGYFMLGATPVRKAEHESDGLWPTDGARAENDWLGLTPFAERARVRNPAAGYLVTANGKITPDSFRHRITAAWDDPGRAQRIDDLLNARQTHDLDSFKSIQLDVGSVKTQALRDVFLRTAPAREIDAAALEVLRGWNGYYEADAAAPAIFAAFEMALLERVYRDELGDAFAYAHGRRSQFLLDVFNGDIAHWCDDVHTAATERCEDLLAPALSAAVDGLVEIYGDAFASWRWGEMLRIRFDHSGMAAFPVLGDVFAREVARDGGPSSPNVAYYRSAAMPRIIGAPHGPSIRYVVDLADFDANGFMIATGQSGHFRSPHYDDLQKLWAAGDYIRLPMNASDIDVAGEIVLRPE